MYGGYAPYAGGGVPLTPCPCFALFIVPCDSYYKPIFSKIQLYIFYTFNGDKIDSFPNGESLNHNTELGWYCFKYSDDNGRTWSDRYRIPMRETTVDYLNPWNGKVQLFWGISKPFDLENKMYFSFTKMAIHPQDMGEGFLYKSENINFEKDPKKIKWELLPEGNTGISYTPLGVTQEEHNIVPLNNGDLYCMYRTSEGYPANTYSKDKGKTWSIPEYAKYADGRVIKNPRACPRVFKTSNGKYLLWFHNNNIKGYKGHRNPVWISGGIEVDGKILWSQPEVLLYGQEGIFGMSYPDLIEENGKYWITETQKTIARVHLIDNEFLENLWKQGVVKERITRGLIFEKSNIPAKTNITSLRLPRLRNGSLSIELLLDVNELVPGQVILENSDEKGNGITISISNQRTVEIVLLSNGQKTSFDTDPGAVAVGVNHIVFNIDGESKLLTSVVNGELCDGGRYRLQGWSWFPSDIDQVNGNEIIRIAPLFDGKVSMLRIYGRYLTTTEAISNYRSQLFAKTKTFNNGGR